MASTPNSVTKKFKEQVNYLIEQGVVGNQQEIVDTIKWHKSGMSQAMNLTKNVPIAVYRKFTSTYKLDEPQESQVNEEATYAYKDKYIASLEKQVKILENQVSLATGELRHVAVMNFAMLQVMRKTVAQILAGVQKGDILKIAEKIDTETAAYYRTIREKGSLIDVGI